MLTTFETTERQVEHADRATPNIFGAVVATSDRVQLLKRQGKTGRLERLVTDGAWTEAALELMSLGAPEWTLGRLCRIDGEWLCTLTRHPDVPDWLDDSIERTHGSLHLALLGAVLEALRLRDAVGPAARQPSRPDLVLDGSDYR